MLHRITDEPCPSRAYGYTNRTYQIKQVDRPHWVEKLKAGQRLVVLKDKADSAQSCVTQWLKSRGIPYTRVVKKAKCADQFGGVWWMNEESERALNSAPEPTKMLQVRRPRFGQQKEKKPPFKLYEQKPNGKIETVLNGWWFN